MKHSAGILISMKTDEEIKYLVIHPTNASWKGTFSIPKGEYDPSEETVIMAALREVFEEVGVNILLDEIENINNPEVIVYKDKNGKKYKEVTVFIARTSMTKMAKFLNDDLTIKDELLQKKEVNWAGFLCKKDLETKIFWRFKNLIFGDLENNG